MHAKRGRQAGAQHVQGMADQRRHQHRSHAPFGDDGREDGLDLGGLLRGGADRVGQGPGAHGRRIQVQVQVQAAAVGLVMLVAAGDQQQVLAAAVGDSEVAREALHAAAPAVQHVQQRGPRGGRQRGRLRVGDAGLEAGQGQGQFVAARRQLRADVKAGQQAAAQGAVAPGQRRAAPKRADAGPRRVRETGVFGQAPRQRAAPVGIGAFREQPPAAVQRRQHIPAARLPGGGQRSPEALGQLGIPTQQQNIVPRMLVRRTRERLVGRVRHARNAGHAFRHGHGWTAGRSGVGDPEAQDRKGVGIHADCSVSGGGAGAAGW